MELSNKFLAVLVVVVTAMSGFSTIMLLNKLSGIPTVPDKVAARASDVYSKVNLSIESTISIILRGNTLIDFGSGYVNTSDVSNCYWESYSFHANLTVDDTGYNDENNCWVSQTATPNEPIQPFRIENDGNQNVSLTINCPSGNTMFASYTGDNRKNLTWKARNNETNACGVVGDLSDTYTACDGTDQPVCDNTNFKYSPEGPTGDGDEIAVDIQLIVPSGLTAASEYNSTILFTASNP